MTLGEVFALPGEDRILMPEIGIEVSLAELYADPRRLQNERTVQPS
jgi:hypothetical protein